MAAIVRGTGSLLSWTYRKATDPGVLGVAAGIGGHYLNEYLKATGSIDEATARVNEGYCGAFFGAGAYSLGSRLWSWANGPKALEKMTIAELRAEHTRVGTSNTERLAAIATIYQDKLQAQAARARPRVAGTEPPARTVAREQSPAAGVSREETFTRDEVARMIAAADSEGQEKGREAAEAELRPAFDSLRARVEEREGVRGGPSSRGVRRPTRGGYEASRVEEYAAEGGY